MALSSAAMVSVCRIGSRLHRPLLRIRSPCLAIDDFRERRPTNKFNNSRCLWSTKLLGSRFIRTIPNDNKSDESNLSLSTHAQAKQLFAKYGTVFLGTYLGVYITTLLSLFAALEHGVVDVQMLSHLKETIPHFGDMFGFGGLFGGINDKLSEGIYHIVPQEQMDWMKGNNHLSNLVICILMRVVLIFHIKARLLTLIRL